MVEVRVCLGSSCHIRGGGQTLRLLQSLIDAHDVTGQVNLAADLCLDNCLQAPNVVVNGKVFGGISPDKVEAFFLAEILSKANE